MEASQTDTLILESIDPNSLIPNLSNSNDSLDSDAALSAKTRLPLTPDLLYQEQRALLFAVHLILLLTLVLKYLFPGKMRNTHTKVLAFMFVLQALNMYKYGDKTGNGWYVVVMLSVLQGAAHGFKVSSFIRSKKAL